MAGTKRPHCWVDYDSDESDTLIEDDSTTKPTLAPTVAPDSKRRKVESHSQPRPGPSPSKLVSPSSNLATTAPSLPTSPARRPPRYGRDLLSPLSDELLIRILSFLPLQHLLSVAPVSRRFYHLAGDSQLWKALYYARFVLPRAMRIPGFRFNGVQPASGTGTGHKLHYKGRRRLWVDGRRGGIVDDQYQQSQSQTGLGSGEDIGLEEKKVTAQPGVNWKRQYKIRYNWSRGKCVVEELKVGGDPHEESDGRDGTEKKKMLAKVVEGIAITANEASGLRAWDLKTRKLVAQVDLATERDGRVAPSCIAIDEKQPNAEVIDVSLGFVDGSFGVWRVFIGRKRIEERYRHEKSSNGELIAMAFAYPYILTATESVLVSLYTFDVPEKMADTGKSRAGPLLAPYLLTSLNSHTSRPPLALSIRRAATTTIASIAYTFSTRRGWSIGIQDLHIRPSNVVGLKSTPEITTTQTAYTTPMDTGYVLRLPPTPPATPRRHGIGSHRHMNRGSTAQPSPQLPPPSPEPGPTSLCYTHPYLLATLPDNTLILHMCNSNASSLSISDGIRLWGHTSGVSDAEVTARGKAVSVSTRGEEMRVWELEGGRMTGIGSSRSVEIKPGSSSSSSTNRTGLEGDSIGYDWEERRNWVGFDDEMVIVLKERGGPGSESLMVYDFT